MPEFALLNLDKLEVVDCSNRYGYKVKEALANGLSLDFLWLFTVPADNQPVPALPAAESGRNLRARPAPSARIPVGHWAGDRVLIVNQDSGFAEGNLPADVLAHFPKGDPQEYVVEYVMEHFKHVALPEYKRATGGAVDPLFPNDRVWVVRNLTKHWYARSDVLVKAPYRRGPAFTGRGMGPSDLIWAEIGGASCVGHSYGHKFDVQTLSTVENAEDGLQWQDLSKEKKRDLQSFGLDDDVIEYRRS
ncbi:hypothetical protein C8R47DRAFT_1327525 [Mycena vitilis]|nr:hypothetical protein C8R47DRAFT_1327525 [Mycena vitilis]